MRPGEILIVEDERADAILIERALGKGGITNPSRILTDGEEALAYLDGAPPFDNRALYPLPALILLDLKLPKVNGLDVLRQIKSSSALKRMPVIVLTSSARADDIDSAYELGANSYLVKPPRFADFCELATRLRLYWLQLNHPPLLPS
jgi:CheY-like chemotaxis protein